MKLQAPAKFLIFVAAIAWLSHLTGAATVSDLITQLAGDDWTARQSAEDALVGRGPAALDDLNATLATTSDVDLRERINSAIARIGREQITGGTPFTIDKTFGRPIDALRAVANAQGLSIVAESDRAAAAIESNRPTTLKYDGAPWLRALLNCAADCGAAVRLSGEQIIVLDKPATEGRPRLAMAGAIAVVVDSGRRSESVDLASDRHNTSTYISVSIFTEPKLRLAAGSTTLLIKTMLDEQGRSLMKKPMKIPCTHLPDGRWTCNVPLLMPDPPATRIAKFDSQLLADVVTETDQLRVDDITSLPADVQTAQGPIGIRSVSQMNGNWSIDVHVPQGRSNTSVFNARIWQMGDPDLMKITDSKGRRLVTGPPTMAMGDDLEMTMPITLAAPDSPPRSVLIRVPSRTRELRVPATLSDLSLP